MRDWRHPKPEPAVLVIVCAVELVALTTGVCPPWTHMLMRLPKTARASVVGAASYWLAHHLEVV